LYEKFCYTEEEITEITNKCDSECDECIDSDICQFNVKLRKQFFMQNLAYEENFKGKSKAKIYLDNGDAEKYFKRKFDTFNFKIKLTQTNREENSCEKFYLNSQNQIIMETRLPFYDYENKKYLHKRPNHDDDNEQSEDKNSTISEICQPIEAAKLEFDLDIEF
jgi:hypothetical protein